MRRLFYCFAGCLLGLVAGCRSAPEALLPVEPFTFVQMCDPQIGFGGREADLARFNEAVRTMNALRPDFAVICGDLVNNPNDPSFKEFNDVKSRLECPCYCAPGNHDLGNSPTPESLARYRKWLGKDYFSFEHKQRIFVLVNAQLWKTPIPGETEKQDAWLKRTLTSAGRKHQPVFIVSHYPLFVKSVTETNGYFNVPEPKRSELLNLFQSAGVVAVLAGHTHETRTTQYRGIQMVNSQTTSRKFDKEPFGFRLWHVEGVPPYRNEFVRLPNQFTAESK
jgi:predicted phosphodiesterase